MGNGHLTLASKVNLLVIISEGLPWFHTTKTLFQIAVEKYKLSSSGAFGASQNNLLRIYSYSEALNQLKIPSLEQGFSNFIGCDSYKLLR